jgi:hypothetical protein
MKNRNLRICTSTPMKKTRDKILDELVKAPEQRDALFIAKKKIKER